MAIRIRRARRSECAALTRIAHAAKGFWGYSEDLLRAWKADLTVSPETFAQGDVWCATHDSRVVGFYATSGEGRERELEHMWVAPAHIGTGVGRALFEHLVAQLREAGVARLRVASDPNAEGFYGSLGARRVGRVPSKPRGRTLPLLVVRIPAPRKRSAKTE
jgi:N-acetylglutamate synthase-like GNAT family acetyltransferase